MKTNSILFLCLLAVAFLFNQCHTHETETASKVTTPTIEAISNKATETQEVATKAISDKVTEAKEAVQTNIAPATESIEQKVNEVTPTLTAIKTEVAEKAKVIKEKAPEKKKTVAKKVASKPKKKKKRASSAIKFETLSHGFGTIKQGEVVKYDFKFKNVGKAPLVIKKVDVSCGCTFPSYPFIPIEPGKEGTIGITYDSKNKAGRQKPTITVVTNGTPRTLKLHLEGYVE